MESTVKEPNDEIPFGLPENKTVHYRLMYDLLALAFEGDLTRSATFMLGKDLSGASFPESGFNGAWHGSSHHGDKPENVANYAKMNRYHVQNLAYFAEKLSKTPDGDGTLLDHILIYKGSNMGNSHRHAHVKVPVILLGGIDGTFKGNRHIVFPGQHGADVEHAAALLHKYGIEDIPKYDAAGRQVGHAGIVRFAAPSRFRCSRMRRFRARIAILCSAAGRRRTVPRARRSNGRTGPCGTVIRKNCTSCHGIDDYAFYALDQSRLVEAHCREAQAGISSLPERIGRCCSTGWRSDSVRTPSRFRAPTFRPRSPRSSPIPKRSA